jgi:hypothetical protein
MSVQIPVSLDQWELVDETEQVTDYSRRGASNDVDQRYVTGGEYRYVYTVGEETYTLTIDLETTVSPHRVQFDLKPHDVQTNHSIDVYDEGPRVKAVFEDEGRYSEVSDAHAACAYHAEKFLQNTLAS